MVDIERPFGDLYTKSDYNFFAAMSDKIQWRRTPEEETETSIILRTTYADIAKVQEDRYAKLIHEIQLEDGIEVKVSPRDDPEKLFVLSADPIDFALVQAERRTKLLFQPDPGLQYDPFFIYDLFFDQIPKALYSHGKDVPTQAHIIKSTNITIITIENNQKGFNLQLPSGKDDFEKTMETPEEIDSVTLYCDGESVSYTLIFPNPANKNDKYIQFSFPSMIPITPKAIDVLFGIHKDGGKLNGNNRSYAKSFASAINRIREELRVR